MGLQAHRPDRPHHRRTPAPMTSSSPDSRVHNLEFSVGGLVREVKPSASKEATVCWMVNVVRQEGKGEAMTVLARRCMDRFLMSTCHLQDLLTEPHLCPESPKVRRQRIRHAGA